MSPYLKDWKREGFYHNEDKGGFFDNFKEEYLHFFFGVTHPKNTSLKCSGEVGLMSLPRIYFELKLDDHYEALQEFNKNKN